jgi:hypothetical protein
MAIVARPWVGHREWALSGRALCGDTQRGYWDHVAEKLEEEEAESPMVG